MHATSPKARNPGFTNGIAEIRHVMHVHSLKMEETIVQAAKKLKYTHVRKEQMKSSFPLRTGTTDVFVSLPTGFGKTFCYSVLPVPRGR